MGPSYFADDHDPNIILSDFKIHKVLGRGSFGKVYLVELKNKGEVYAMKCLDKKKLIEEDLIKDTILEK